MHPAKPTRSERRFLSCLSPFTLETQSFVIRQSEPLNSVSALSHFDISVFALYRGFVALAIVPPGTEPEILLMYRTGDPTQPMFRMPSILVWFGLVGQDIRQVHNPRTYAVDDGAILCWYYCPVAEMPPDLVAFFGGSVGLNFTI
jgi:hypothetical protein